MHPFHISHPQKATDQSLRLLTHLEFSMKHCLQTLLISLLALPLLAQDALIIAGGGSEGDQGDTSSWSYHLYRNLVLGNDTNNDGQIKVVILATDIPNQQADANWLPNYFQWLGSDAGITVTATNLEVATRNAANNSGTVSVLNDADALFIKGGDQGEYYDLWNGTLLETQIQDLANRNGRLGGTSAGAMSMAQYAFAGGQDMISDDVLADAQTYYLNDASSGGSGIHTDFFGFLGGAVIDTHFTQRGRLGRLAGILAKANDDANRSDLLGIGLEMNTGLIIQNQTATVVGEGSVTFLQEGSSTIRIRQSGKPLVYTNLIMDRLTDGWQFDLSTNKPDTQNLPSGSNAFSVNLYDNANSGALTLNGSNESESNKFAFSGTYYPNDYASTSGTASPYIRDSVGFTDAGNSNNRMDKHETLFHLLHDQPADIGFLVYSGGTLERTSSASDKIQFSGSASLVIDAAAATHKGLSPYASPWATDGGSLKAAAFACARLHIIGDSATHGKGYNSRTHQVIDVGGSNPPGSGNSETESNDTRNTANDLTSMALPLTITGTMDTSSDLDYFKIELARNATINLQLDVPSGVDYDLYLLDNRGRTKARSVNDGNGVDETINYTNTSRKTITLYVEVSSYSGSGGQYSLQLSN